MSRVRPAQSGQGPEGVKRTAATILCVLSLLLFAVSAVLWIRGCRGGDTLVLSHLRSRDGKWISGNWQLQTWQSGLKFNHTQWELAREWHVNRPQLSSPL